MELIDIDDSLRSIIYEGTMTHSHRHLRKIDYSFRNAAIEKLTSGLTTVQEILRVLPRSAFYHNKDNVEKSHLVTT